MTKFIRVSIYSLCLLFVLACQREDKQEEIAIDEKAIDSNLVLQDKFNAQNVFNSLPTQSLVMRLVAENKLQYNPDLLNNPANVNKFSLELFRALNLGIYGADMCVASSFDQTQESIIFLKSINILAGSLGVSSAFSQNMFDRIEANKSNNDSVVEIVTGAFKKVDEILKYNKRAATAAIILSGCWIEGFYISCKMAQKTDDQKVIKTIIEQKESLKNLIVLLDNAGLESDSKFITDKLRGLLKTILIYESGSKFDKEAIAATNQKIEDLRNQVVSVIN